MDEGPDRVRPGRTEPVGDGRLLRGREQHSRGLRFLAGAISAMLLIALGWLVVLGLIAATRAVL